MKAMASNGFVLGFGFEGLGIVSDFGFSASDLSILISKHPHFPFCSYRASFGACYPITDSFHPDLPRIGSLGAGWHISGSGGKQSELNSHLRIAG